MTIFDKPIPSYADSQNVRVWTKEEQDLTAASIAYFQAIATCEQAGGNSGDAIMEAMPVEVRDAMKIGGINPASILGGVH